MNKQECLHPHEEADHHDDREDLEEDPEEGSEEDPDKNEDDNSFHSNNEVSNTSNHSNNNGNSNHRNSTTTANSATTRIQANDPCPLPGHLGHNWGQCFQNKNNTSTRPTRPTTHSPERDAHVNEHSRDFHRTPRQSRHRHPRQSTTRTNTRRSTRHRRNDRDTEESESERYDSYFMDFQPQISNAPATSADTNSDVDILSVNEYPTIKKINLLEQYYTCRPFQPQAQHLSRSDMPNVYELPIVNRPSTRA
jgi:hypothetical protein